MKIYFGTGLASSKEESLGFGFEFLNTMLTSLVLTKESDADGIYHEIGTVGYNISGTRRNILIEEQMNIINSIIKNLGIENIYDVVPSHSYHNCDYFKKLLRYVCRRLENYGYIHNFKKYGHYTIIQLAQMKYLYEVENAKVKVGWRIGNKPLIEKVDANRVVELINCGHLSEYYFDSMYRFVFPNDKFSFIYTSAGIDAINGRKYAPYTVTKSQNRPLLTQNITEYFDRIPDNKHKRKVLRIYESTIIKNWEELFGKIYAEDILEKLQFIQNIVI